MSCLKYLLLNQQLLLLRLLYVNKFICDIKSCNDLKLYMKIRTRDRNLYQQIKKYKAWFFLVSYQTVSCCFCFLFVPQLYFDVKSCNYFKYYIKINVNEKNYHI